MSVISCPWCDTELRLEPAQLDRSELGCLDCSSTWLVRGLPQESALAA